MRYFAPPSVAYAALAAFRRGVGTADTWEDLLAAICSSGSLASIGVGHGMHGHLASARIALQEIHKRSMETGVWPVPHLDEIDVLQTALELYALQLAAKPVRDLPLIAAATAGPGPPPPARSDQQSLFPQQQFHTPERYL